MRIPRLRISILAAVAVVGATAAVALGAPSRARDNSTPVKHALAKTAKVTSGHFSLSVSISGGAAAQAGAFTITATGGFDAKKQETESKVNLGSLATLLGSLGGSAGSIPQVIDAVSQKTVVYLHIPAIAKQLGGSGKEWISIDASKLPKTLTAGVGVGQLSKTTSSTKVLAALTSSATVHKVGKTTVRGASTTHYRLTVNSTKVVKAIVPKAQQAGALKSLKTSGTNTIPIQIYVDGSGYVTRVEGSFKVKSQGSPPLNIKLRVDLYDPGATVDVTVPPANQVADATQMISGLLGSLGGGG